MVKMFMSDPLMFRPGSASPRPRAPALDGAAPGAALRQILDVLPADPPALAELAKGQLPRGHHQVDFGRTQRQILRRLFHGGVPTSLNVYCHRNFSNLE